MSDVPAAHEVALHIASTLNSSGIDYAIGGALALNLWGPARGTRDVDINLFIQASALGDAFEALELAGVILDRDKCLRRSKREGMFVGDYNGMRIDVFVPSIEFSWVAAASRVTVQTDHGPIDFLSAEALAVFKLLFFRPKDIVDLSNLIALQRDDMDHASVREHIVKMMGEEDERVHTWDRILREQLSLDP